MMIENVVSRDTNADLDRLRDHFDRLIEVNDRCGCREGECESKPDRVCRMAVEVANGDQ